MGAPAVRKGGIHVSAFIHPLAVVDESCGINAECKVWQFASVTGGTVLGPGCSVSPFAMLHGPRFGARCLISGGVMMGPGFHIGDDCFIGPNVVLCNDAWPSVSKVGYEAEELRDGRLVTVRVGNGVGIGAGAIILPGVTIGDGAFVAAGAVLDRDLPAGHLFTRKGRAVEIQPGWAKRRMRRAG
jgi:acetyltransferase-like isoleucine patch superfamily enzyme